MFRRVASLLLSGAYSGERTDIDFLCVMMISLREVIYLHRIASDYKISTRVRQIKAPLTIGYRHVPLVDLQGEKYIYSTLFVKIAWTVSENVPERQLLSVSNKLEKKNKPKAPMNLRNEEASVSGTSIESNSSGGATSVESGDVRELTRMSEVDIKERP
jgi:hypothetical protein